MLTVDKVHHIVPLLDEIVFIKVRIFCYHTAMFCLLPISFSYKNK